MAAVPCAKKRSPRTIRETSPCIGQSNPHVSMEDEDSNSSSKIEFRWPHVAASSKPCGRGRNRGRGRGKQRIRPLPEPPRPSEASCVELAEDDATKWAFMSSGCLTRGARQRLSLPLTTVSQQKGRYNPPAKTACKRRATDTYDDHTNNLVAARNVSHTHSELSVALPDDDNVTDHGVMDMDHNTNARRRQRPKRKPNANTHPRQKGGSAPIRNSRLTSTHMVNFAALKPISAVCSSSGMGLVVTYRPCFSETIKSIKKKNRRQSRSVSQSCMFLKSKTQGKRYQDSATSPRSPSPGRKVKSSSPPSLFSQIYAKAHNNTEQGHEVKTWQDDEPNSPRIKTHRSPSPELPSCATGTDQRRKSPIPGPSWAPDELTRPRSTSASPASSSRRIVSRRCSRRRRGHGKSPRHVLPLTTSEQHQFTNTSRRARTGSPLSPKQSPKRRSYSRNSPHVIIANSKEAPSYRPPSPPPAYQYGKPRLPDSTPLPIYPHHQCDAVNEEYGRSPVWGSLPVQRRKTSSSQQPNVVISEGWDVNRSTESCSPVRGGQQEREAQNMGSASPNPRSAHASRWREPDDTSSLLLEQRKDRSRSRSYSRSPAFSYSDTSVMSREFYDDNADQRAWRKRGGHEGRGPPRRQPRRRSQQDSSSDNDTRAGNACRVM